MDSEQQIRIISAVPLFTGLTKDELKAVASKTKAVEFEAGELIIEQDDTSDGAYILCHGMVKVYRLTDDGEEINLAVLGPGEILGEMSLIDDQPRSANVEAIQHTQLLLLTREDFSKILHQHTDAAINLLATLSHRVRATNEYVEDVFSKNLAERTWKTLQTLSRYFPNNDITLSQEELATIIGATRARVTEILDQLQIEGKLTLSHRKIHLM